jgi:acetyl esterase/lipase
MADVNELLQARIAYRVPEMELVDVASDNIYKIIDGEPLMFDVYRPFDGDDRARLPAVIFVHGEGPPEVVKTARSWGQYVSWGQLIAKSGMAAVIFNHRSSDQYAQVRDAGADVDDLIAYVLENAERYGIDATRLAVWTCSAGGPYALRAALNASPQYVQCIVAYYAICDVLHLAEEPSSTLDEQTLEEFSPYYFINQYPERVPPLFVAKAELDQPHINRSLDRFSQRAEDNGVIVERVTHQSGRHGFDVIDEDDTTREIIRRTVHFLKLHLHA